MSDYFLGLAISSLIALLMSIKKTWRLRPNGLINALILAGIFILSFVLFGISSSSSGPFIGFLGMITIPVYLVAKNRPLTKTKNTRASGQIKKRKSPGAKVIVRTTEQLPVIHQNTSTDIKTRKPASGIKFT